MTAEDGKQIAQFVNNLDSFLPNVSMDCVVFGYREQQLHVLLLKWKRIDAWALPGGFLSYDEEMEHAVNRVLFERTGLEDIFLSQFYTFSPLSRGWDCNELSKNAFQHIMDMSPKGLQDKLKAWFEQRFITTGFLALMDAEKAKPIADYFSEYCKWVPVNDLPPLILDHKVIIKDALEYLKIKINYLPIGRSLLADRFTMQDLQSLYESILQKQLDRGNFQRKIQKLKMLKRHDKLMTGAANKAPYLYSFDDQVYLQLIEDGIGFTF